MLSWLQLQFVQAPIPLIAVIFAVTYLVYYEYSRNIDSKPVFAYSMLALAFLIVVPLMFVVVRGATTTLPSIESSAGYALFDDSGYDFSFAFPSKQFVFSALSPTSHRKGVSASSPGHDAVIEVWESRVSEGDSLSSWKESITRECVRGAASYVAGDDKLWAVVSCLERDNPQQVLYRKRLVAGGIQTDLSMRYPKFNKLVWDDVVEKIERTLRIR